MKLIVRGIQFLIPLVVLYTIGYYIPGFSGLTISWLILLSALIFLGEWLIDKSMEKMVNRIGRSLISFLVATVIIITVTLGIEGGNVPLSGALFAAAIIAALSALVNPGKTKQSEVRRRN